MTSWVPGAIRCRRAVPAACLASALILVTAGPSALLAQAREWWDTYEEATRIIEDKGASQEQLNSARRSLLRVIRSQDTEGSLATYNPSVRIDYLPYFYLGWAEMRLGRYYDASRRFDRSAEIGFVTRGAPRGIQERFHQLRDLAGALKPAAESLESARKNATVSQCLEGGGAASAPGLREAMDRLEGLLAAPTSASGIDGAVKALESAVGECVRELAGARMARAAESYGAARDAVSVEGISEVLPAEAARSLQAAVDAGDEARASGDEEGMRRAAADLEKMRPRITSAVDSSMASLVGRADDLLKGNEATLNSRGQLGTRLKGAATRARSQKASGRSGRELAAVVATGRELKGLVAEAGKVMEPLLKASRSSLAGARRAFEQWAREKGCQLDAVEASTTVRRAASDAESALQGSSADAMGSAGENLASVRQAVDRQISGALPRVRQQASGIVGSAESVLKNVSSAEDRARGEGLKKKVEQATGSGDICAIEEATASLRSWVSTVAPALEEGRRKAIARNMPALDDAQALLESFGGILDGETVTALQEPAERLTGLVKSSYDPEAIDEAGEQVRALVARASSQVKGSMEQGLASLESLTKEPRWKDVEESRRRWLEQNASRVRKAVGSMDSPELLARFARELPRARAEVALRSAFDSLYARNDAAAAARALEGLGPGIRSGSAALNYALSYVYWWQARSAPEGEREELLERARAAFQAGRDLKMDPAGLAGTLFAPAFVTDMAEL